MNFKDLSVARSQVMDVSMEEVSGSKYHSKILRLDLLDKETFYLETFKGKYPLIFAVCEKHPEAEISIYYTEGFFLEFKAKRIFQLEIASRKILAFEEARKRSIGISVLTGVFLIGWFCVSMYWIRKS